MKNALRPFFNRSQSITVGRYMMSTEATGGPVESAIRQKILDSFSSSSSIHLDVVNESHKHNVPKGSESHFNVLVVSDAFEGLKLIERHRLVNKVLAVELATKIHALSIQAKTWTQWRADPAFIETPNCLGGSKK